MYIFYFLKISSYLLPNSSKTTFKFENNNIISILNFKKIKIDISGITKVSEDPKKR